MKLTKAEKIWLLATTIVYGLYNLPGFPVYGDKDTAVIHGFVSIALIWASCYIGFFKINKIYKLKEVKREGRE